MRSLNSSRFPPAKPWHGCWSGSSPARFNGLDPRGSSVPGVRCSDISMPKPLVIVESPAKARTLARFLGSKYRVEASYGHIRDLPESAKEVPAEIKGKSWGRLGVDTEGDFTPYYVVPADKKKNVTA